MSIVLYAWVVQRGSGEMRDGVDDGMRHAITWLDAAPFTKSLIDPGIPLCEDLALETHHSGLAMK